MFATRVCSRSLEPNIEAAFLVEPKDSEVMLDHASFLVSRHGRDELCLSLACATSESCSLSKFLNACMCACLIWGLSIA